MIIIPNFTKVGSQYALSNLDIKVPQTDSILHLNSSGNITGMPICRDWLTAFHDGTQDDTLLTFGSMKEYGVIAGSTSVFGEYTQKWKLTNEYQNIGNNTLIENSVVKRTYDSMILKRAVYGLLLFNGYVTKNTDQFASYAWVRIKNMTQDVVIMEQIIPIPYTGYEISFSCNACKFLNKNDVLRFEMSCNTGADISVNGPRTYAHLIALNLYEEEWQKPSKG